MHATLSDVIADTAHNSIEAGASRVLVEIEEDGKYFKVTIDDNGKGMDEDVLKRAFNPFYTEAGKHDKRKVGLGLPILKQLCDATDGSVSLKSEYNLDKTTKKPKPYDKNEITGKYFVRGKNKELAIKNGLPLSYDRLAVMAVSVFHLSHWRCDVTIANYILNNKI